MYYLSGYIYLYMTTTERSGYDNIIYAYLYTGSVPVFRVNRVLTF